MKTRYIRCPYCNYVVEISYFILKFKCYDCYKVLDVSKQNFEINDMVIHYSGKAKVVNKKEDGDIEIEFLTGSCRYTKPIRQIVNPLDVILLKEDVSG